jgi:hypothetical protein
LEENIEVDNKQEYDVDVADTMAQTINDEYIDRQILKLNAEIQSDKSTSKGMQIFFGGLTLLTILEFFFKIFHWNIWVIGISFFVNFLIFCASFTTSKQEKLKSEIDMWNNKKVHLVGVKRTVNSSKHFDTLVSINISNLEEYYDLVKQSNQRSFTVSLSMSILGVLLILTGLAYSFLIGNDNNITYLAAASGIVVELISGLLFYLYNRTVIQLKDYHDSLLDVQNILLSFKLIDDLKDEEHKSATMKQMIEFLVRKQ